MTTVDDWASTTEAALLRAATGLAPRLGWTSRMVRAAAAEAGLSDGEAALLLPHGARDLAALLAADHDRRALAALAATDPAALKVRERIRAAVLARLDCAMRDEPALRRWMGFLLLPANAALGARLIWASADILWRWAGDVATDENHYTKRLLLGEILLSSLAIRLEVGGEAAARHVDRRIAGVMAFEKWKAALHPGAIAGRVVRRLGRWRYRPGAVQAALPGPVSAGARSPG